MLNERLARCCAACGLDESHPKATLIDQAAGFADDWYASHPMPCGSAAATEAYHAECRNHVKAGVCSCAGVLMMLTIVYYLTQICYTVFRWRKEREDDKPKA